MLKFSNFGKALVGSAPSGTSGLNFTVESGKGVNFPTLAAGDYFYGIFKDASGNREIVKIEARSGDAMTIAVGGRGLDGTTARTWNAGDYFVAGLTNIALQESLSNANLTALGALSTAADKIAYWTGSGVAALTSITSFIRTLFAAEDAAAARTILKAVGTEGNETIAGAKTFSNAVSCSATLSVSGTLTPSGGIVGTSTNNNAAAGSVGEYISSTVAAGSAVALTTATAKTITSISLTAGDWDISGQVLVNGTSTTQISTLFGSCSLASNSVDAAKGFLYVTQAFTPGAAFDVGFAIPTVRLSIASTTTVYLVARATFGTSALSAYGYIGARRAR